MMRFTSKRALLEYLTDDPKGKKLLREAVLTEGLEWLARECLDRWFPPHIPRQKVLVKVFRDGLVEAYGSENVDVKIVLLHRSCTIPEHEIAQEQRLDASLPPAYREIHFPVNEKACALAGFDEIIA
jgi:hypothetical protein